MKYDFTTVLDRRGKDSIAVEPFASDWMTWPAKTKEGFDLIPMWVVVVSYTHLITVEQGLEQGKEIYAVPGQITDHLSMGCNQLIQQGAGILTSPDDIFDYFQIGKKLRLREKNKNGLAKNEKMVYSCLDFHPKYIDQVVEESGLPLGEVMILLLELETKGYIQQPVNHYYVKRCV